MKTERLRGYAALISKATGVTDTGTLEEIEECMRCDLFHSTLDWQTKRQLNKAAREAHEVVKYLRMQEEGVLPNGR